MILIRFRVKNFRSISDSGWVDNDKVTALVGVNEAGKSNLLLALWKLNPATGGEINKLEDMPRSNYSEWRDQEEQQTFITCEFELQDTNLINEIMKLTSCNENDIAKVSISRTYSGQRSIGFPNFKQERFFKKVLYLILLRRVKISYRLQMKWVLQKRPERRNFSGIQ